MKGNRSGKARDEGRVVAGISGGSDSVYLLEWLFESGKDFVIAHFNHGVRGSDSQADQEMVEALGKTRGIPVVVGSFPAGSRWLGKTQGHAKSLRGFECEARRARLAFFREIAGGKPVYLAHTADDQVETVLMRILEGAGVSGLKGIPRETGREIIHPILHVWKSDILKYLENKNIPYRVDRSNFDLRFERNWIRNVLIPLLEKRYGKSLKKRIYTLGERFRELDDYLVAEASRWARRYLKTAETGERRFPRKRYSGLPTVLRAMVLQRVCFERTGVAPNERLIGLMDRLVREGRPSARVKIGKGWELVNRYGETALAPVGNVRGGGEETGTRAGRAATPGLHVEERGKVGPAQARRTAAKGDREFFDAATLRMPLSVRPLRMGDRIRPFGLGTEKKVKDLLIDRKVPREDRWGRPVVCDAEGNILWIPGVVRSAHAPVTPQTRKTLLLKVASRTPGMSGTPARPRK